ncbi:polyhydroxybutyrate depolymerase [Alteromonas sp. A079]|uniref:extracellular catalytic domain type 2 short-chain-length polyhydroxyalkanoate depolymerase n=1 Tax=Alteromonas sp. A079 TaxID=3410268 RepID=UPI003B9F0D02
MKLKTIFSALCIATSGYAAAATPMLNLQLDNVTVSGLSSGGYMATQFHVANSDWVSGSGVLAGGPYWCAQGDITVALRQCVNTVDEPIDIKALNETAKRYEANGKIAPLTNLANDKVWLFHGTQDTRVVAEVSDSLHAMYSEWVASDRIKYINDKAIAHVFPTVSSGSDCITSETPFIGNCNYNAAGEMLKHLLPDIAEPDDTLSGKVMTIDQQAMAGDNAKTLASEGFVYVPKSCAEGEQCRAHISFHGCNQYADAVGDAYVTQTGLNEWADDNHLIVLYPQTKKSMFMPLNPQGCWDWWGYTSSDYANREGAQIKAVAAMLRGLNTMREGAE